MTTRKEKIEQTLDIVHKLEDRYGSIDKTPASRPELTITHKIFEESNSEPITVSNEEVKEIGRLWKQGYFDKEIADELFLPDDLVSRHRSKLGKPNRKNYTLKRGFEQFNFESLIKLSKFFGYTYQKPLDHLKDKAKEKGWTIKEKRTHDY